MKYSIFAIVAALVFAHSQAAGLFTGANLGIDFSKFPYLRHLMARHAVNFDDEDTLTMFKKALPILFRESSNDLYSESGLNFLRDVLKNNPHLLDEDENLSDEWSTFLSGAEEDSFWTPPGFRGNPNYKYDDDDEVAESSEVASYSAYKRPYKYASFKGDVSPLLLDAIVESLQDSDEMRWDPSLIPNIWRDDEEDSAWHPSALPNIYHGEEDALWNPAAIPNIWRDEDNLWNPSGIPSLWNEEDAVLMPDYREAVAQEVLQEFLSDADTNEEEAIFDDEEEEEESDMAGQLSHGQALGRIQPAGISIRSSGGCSNRNQRNCTSLDGINSCTIDNILTLRRASGCPITITGGTEVGHAGGPKSHGSGHKLDIALNACINNYITRSFSYVGKRGDGADTYVAASGNRYHLEGNHWDIVFC